MTYRILIVDDDPMFGEKISEILNTDNRTFNFAYTGKTAVKSITDFEPHLVLLDERLPDTSGLTLLEKIKKQNQDIYVIMITATKTVELAVNAIQKGAHHFITKPFNNAELRNIIKITLDKIEIDQQLTNLKNGISSFDKPFVIGESKPIIQIKEQIQTITDHPFSSILITGETGTGKGSIAKYIHYQYKKNMDKFVHLSCADIAPNLLETELFGYEKGAFTDAKATKKGLIELADGGTLFLDEIDSLPLELQSKLLNFLDDKKIRRVGAVQAKQCDVRLLTATNTNLNTLVYENKFRKDLFYRLNSIKLELPPLRERKEDIKLLSEHFRNIFNLTFSKNINRLSKGAIITLKSHSWPGNIRELKNTIEKAMIFCRNDIIESGDLNIHSNAITDKNKFSENSYNNDEESKNIFSIDLSKNTTPALKEVETLYIKRVLELFKDNRSEAARVLGISRTTLLSKIKN